MLKVKLTGFYIDNTTENISFVDWPTNMLPEKTDKSQTGLYVTTVNDVSIMCKFSKDSDEWRYIWEKKNGIFSGILKLKSSNSFAPNQDLKGASHFFFIQWVIVMIYIPEVKDTLCIRYSPPKKENLSIFFQ